jgi:luciferase family oxidoreductase group 1
VRTARALRRDADLSANSFPDDVVELISYFLPRDEPTASPFATPGSGYLPEVWLLGSSTYSAQLAGMLGLPFSFAYHFAPEQLDAALSLYRSTFRSSIFLERPHAMVAVSVLCAPTIEEAHWLAGPSGLSALLRRSGQMGLLPSPEEAAAYPYSDEDRTFIEHAMSSHIIGDPQGVRDGLVQLQERTYADEIMLSTRAHSLSSRIESVSLIARSWDLTAVA